MDKKSFCLSLRGALNEARVLYCVNSADSACAFVCMIMHVTLVTS